MTGDRLVKEDVLYSVNRLSVRVRDHGEEFLSVLHIPAAVVYVGASEHSSELIYLLIRPEARLVSDEWFDLIMNIVWGESERRETVGEGVHESIDQSLV